MPAPQHRTVYGQIWAVFHFLRPIQPLLKWKHKSRHSCTPREGHKRCTSHTGLVLPPGVNFTLTDFRNIVLFSTENSAFWAYREHLSVKARLFTLSTFISTDFLPFIKGFIFCPQRTWKENNLTGRIKWQIWSLRMKTGKGNFLFLWDGKMLIMLTFPASCRCFSFTSSSPTRALFEFKRPIILVYISPL